MSLKHLARKLIVLLLTVNSLVALNASAHHVLGKPAYNLNEDSSTSPSMQVETQLGEFSINYMVYPAFPKTGEDGRINLFASKLDTGESFSGLVKFKVRDDSWFGGEEELLGIQRADDFVYRQNFVFSEDGDYIITAEFESGGEPYIIDFPLRVGARKASAPLVIAVAIITLSLIVVSLLQRRKEPEESL